MDESTRAAGTATADHECTVCGERFPDEASLRDHLYSVGQVY